MKTKIVFLLTSASVISFFACRKPAIDPSAHVQVLNQAKLYADYHDVLPPAFCFNTLAWNNKVIKLGRVLFYDKKLSLNNAISCASCHHQVNAFADNVRFSNGFENKKTGRNTPAMTNEALCYDFFWDNRETQLESMVLRPIQSHVEMGLISEDMIADKLAHIDYYPALFANAFGTADITSARAGEAIAAFVRSCLSYHSKYDEGNEPSVNFSNFTPLENRGRELFFGTGRCSSCHYGTNLGGNGSATIGLDLFPADLGIGGRTHEAYQNGEFSVPSLRNVALTAPYMHDGRYSTLNDVIDFYSHNIQPVENLSPMLWKEMPWIFFPQTVINAFDPLPVVVNPQADSSPVRFNFSVTDKQALVAFLNTLSDYSVTKDDRYSDPFE